MSKEYCLEKSKEVVARAREMLNPRLREVFDFWVEDMEKQGVDGERARFIVSMEFLVYIKAKEEAEA